MAFRAPKMAPKGPQEAQDGPKMAPSWAQDWPQMGSTSVPKSCQNRSQKGFDFEPLLGTPFGCPLAANLGRSWAILGHLGAVLGHIGAVLGHLGPNLGPSWAILGASWGILGPSWRHLGLSWGHLGVILGPLGAILDYLGPFCGQLGNILEKTTENRTIWKPLWEPEMSKSVELSSIFLFFRVFRED